MRKKKFVILGILFCMAVICLLTPSVRGDGCTNAEAHEEILSEFNPTLVFGIDNFGYPFPIYFSDVTAANSVVGHLQPYLLGGPNTVGKLPDTFMYLDFGAKAATPSEAELSAKAELIARARLGDVYRAVKETDERYGGRDKMNEWEITRLALQQLGVETKKDDKTSFEWGVSQLIPIILEQLHDPNSDLNNPMPLDLSKMGGGGMIMIKPQPVTEDGNSVVGHLQPFVSRTAPVQSEYKKAWNKARDKALKSGKKAGKLKEAEAKAKEAAEKLGKALNDAMNAEPGSEEAKKAAEKVGEAGKEAAETAKEEEKAKEEYEEAKGEADKAIDDWKKVADADKAAEEEADKQNEAAKDAAEKAYKATGHGTGKADKAAGEAAGEAAGKTSKAAKDAAEKAPKATGHGKANKK
jgi:hypothetical protein